MNTNNLIRETLKRLLATAIEKVCVLGEGDAQDDLDYFGPITSIDTTPIKSVVPILRSLRG